MGKTKIQVLGSEEEAKEKKREKKSLKKEKGVRVPGLKGGERVVAVTVEPIDTQKELAIKAVETKKERKKKIRGKKYLSALAKIEPNKFYSISDAVRLVKETLITDFDGSVRLSLVFAKKFNKGDKISVELPFSSGSRKRIEIANDEAIEKIKAGKIDFDVLLATPSQMPRLVPFAKVLGPKGLMPNPKNGTLVDNPEAEIAKFSANSVIVKLAKDGNSTSVVVGKTGQDEKELAANLQEVIKNTLERGLKKMVLSSTMGPGIKLDLG